jgi:hypothetical protein
MPKIRVISSNFTKGEISPRIPGRIDLAAYYNACEKMENFYAYLQGGATRRPGTQYICEAMGPGRLIKFEFSSTNAYILELGDKRMRFYRNGAQIATDTIHPAWSSIVGGTTIDGALTWTNRGFQHWSHSRVDNLNDVIIDPNGNLQICTTPGTSLAAPPPGSGIRDTMPAWATVLNATTSDGTAVWTCLLLPDWLPATAFAANAAVYTNVGVQQVTAGGGGLSGGGVTPPIYEIPTPWALADLAALKFAQKGDVMYFAHQNYPPYKLLRLGEANWQIQLVTFTCPATYEPDFDISGGASTLTPGATTGTGITFTATGTPFLAGDVNRIIVSNNGASTAAITAVTDSSHVVADILSPFPSTSAIAAGSWFLRGAPWGYLRSLPSDTPVDSVGGTAHFFAIEKRGADGSPASGQNCFRAGDVGLYIKIFNGVTKITAVTDAQNVRARVLAQLTPSFNLNTPPQALAAEPGLWTLETPAWTPARGYPGAVVFHEDRLFFGGSPAQPQTIWASVTGDYENLATGSAGDSALDFTINAGLFDAIQWLASGKDLIAGTLSSEIVANGGVQNPSITPSTINVKRQSTYGCAPIQPVQIVNSLLIVQREQRKLREFTFNFYVDQYQGVDLTVLAEHITASGIKEMAYAQEPDSIIWFVLNNGTLIGLSYDKANEVAAWHRHPSAAIWHSLAVIPDPPTLSDQVWMLSERTVVFGILEITNYFIEIMRPDCGVDAATRYSGPPVNAIGGLGYLRGQTVSVVGDGAAYPDAVIDGSFTYTFPPGVNVSKADVGLNFTSTLLTMRPDLQQPTQTIQGLKKRFTKIYARLLSTVGLIINGQRIPFREPQMLMDEGVPAQTIDVKVSNLGVDADGRITVTQDSPFPTTLLAIYGLLEVADSD